MFYPEEIGKRIQSLRKQHHETQEDLAAETGMYQEDISKLEGGKKDSGVADLYKLDAIATHYGISLAELISGKVNASENSVQNGDTADVGDVGRNPVRGDDTVVGGRNPVRGDDTVVGGQNPAQSRNAGTEQSKDSKTLMQSKDTVSLGENAKTAAPERLGTADYPIADIRYDEKWTVAEITLSAPNGKPLFLAFEGDDEIFFYRSKESLFDILAAEERDDKQQKKLDKSRFLYGNDFVDVYRKMNPRWLKLCRLLILAAGERDEEVLALIEEAKGKSVNEIDVPVPFEEPQDIIDVDYSDLSAVYRYRMVIEAHLKNPNVLDDIDRTDKGAKILLEKLKAACVSEEAYKIWKRDLIKAKTEYLMEKGGLVACKYFFIGVGSYREIVPENQVEGFKNWVNCNGSGFFTGTDTPTKTEIKNYVAMHIADDLM